MADALGPELPSRIAHFDIFYNRALGQGSFGSLCVGRDTQNNTNVAIKRVTSYRPRTDLCIERELATLQSISHPNITKLLYHERLGNHTYFFLELCNKDLQRFALQEPRIT